MIRFYPFLMGSVWAFLIGSTPLSHAYLDEIGLPVEEVWQLVKKTAESRGIASVDEEKRVLTTKWVEDRVTRTRSLLPFKGVGTINKTVDRRYRLKIKLMRLEKSTEVRINGKFQQNDNRDRPQQPWKNIKPKTVDYDAERDFFFEMLDTYQQSDELS